ncbi:SHOCT domain-containing protein [Rubrivirga sp.]|uniref:SHOCT domain-containing protein n=1 Tax=Rubrivirga sp. TaxID=1885344 RepID=UPI003B52532F
MSPGVRFKKFPPRDATDWTILDDEYVKTHMYVIQGLPPGTRESEVLNYEGQVDMRLVFEAYRLAPYVYGLGDIDGLCGMCNHMLFENMERHHLMSALCPKYNNTSVYSVGPLVSSITDTISIRPNSSDLRQVGKSALEALDTSEPEEAFAERAWQNGVRWLREDITPQNRGEAIGYLQILLSAIGAWLAWQALRRSVSSENCMGLVGKSPFYKTPSRSADDLIQAIAKLAGLRDAGHISQGEFEVKKAELLARI